MELKLLVAVSPRGRLKLLTSAENLERVTAIERGVKILKPFAISTRFLEADSATLFDQRYVTGMGDYDECNSDSAFVPYLLGGTKLNYELN